MLYWYHSDVKHQSINQSINQQIPNKHTIVDTFSLKWTSYNISQLRLLVRCDIAMGKSTLVKLISDSIQHTQHDGCATNCGGQK